MCINENRVPDKDKIKQKVGRRPMKKRTELAG